MVLKTPKRARLKDPQPSEEQQQGVCGADNSGGFGRATVSAAPPRSLSIPCKPSRCSLRAPRSLRDIFFSSCAQALSGLALE